MANLLDSYGLDFLGKDEDTLMGAVRYTVQEGKAIKGYYDTPYFYLPIGSAEFWASSEKSEDGKLAISGFHTHCGGKTIWEMICTDVDISPKDWPKTERILMMSRSTDNGGMLPVDIITADVLPSFLKDDRLTLQLVAPCLEVNYYATEEEYDKTVPADKQGQKWGIADGALIPLSFLANHLVGNYEDGKEYLLHTPDSKQFIYRNYYDSYWTPVMELIGCSHKPHDTRHTCISMMTEKEVSPTLIKKIVGHSGAMSLTEKVYTHVNVQELLEAINRI